MTKTLESQVQSILEEVLAQVEEGELQSDFMTTYSVYRPSCQVNALGKAKHELLKLGINAYIIDDGGSNYVGIGGHFFHDIYFQTVKAISKRKK
jgi:hypothetical protein